MCSHGTYKKVNIINNNQNKNSVVVDACIADEIQQLNNNGVITISSCCGHGLAGKISEWENEFGSWRGRHDPPHVLIDERSAGMARSLGYRPFPYIFADGNSNGTWKMYLMTGCVTIEDCDVWKEGR